MPQVSPNINALASSFEEIDDDQIPTPLMIYRASLIISSLPPSRRKLLSEPFHVILQTVPLSSLTSIIGDINSAFKSVATVEDPDVKTTSVRALHGLYSSSEAACRAGFDVEVCSKLVRGLDGTDETVDALIAETLSNLLIHGLISKKRNRGEEEESLRRVMEVIRRLMEDNATCLSQVNRWQNANSHSTLVDAIGTEFPDDSEERRYLLQLVQMTAASDRIEPFDRTDSKSKIAANRKKQLNPNTTQSKQTANLSPTDILVNQVREILPHLGRGYVETALACYSSDLNKVLAVLTSGDPSKLHPRLRSLDPSLPSLSRPKEREEISLEDDLEAKEHQLKLLAEMERAQEEEAYVLSKSVALAEYEDDYDDQYDGIGDDGGAVSGGKINDGGMYDVEEDYDTIVAYNKWARGAEADEKFWEENRNANRGSRKKPPSAKEMEDDGDGGEGEEGSEAESGRRKFGPDKGRGGRVIGPDGKYLAPKKPRKTLPQKPKPNASNQKKKEDNTSEEGKKNQKSKPHASNQKKKEDNTSEEGKKKQKPKPHASNQKKKDDNTSEEGKKNQKSKPHASNQKKKEDNTSEEGKKKPPATSSEDAMSKNQKRRKNDNKAKIGNHHRKDRALKKAGGGLV